MKVSSLSVDAIRRQFMFALAAGAGMSVLPAHAQSFPSKPVRIIVPYAAGGGPDVLTRKIGPRLGEILGQPIVIENIVGAGGILAAQSAARAAPDGYTLLLGSSTHITQKAMQPSVRFDPLKDFAHVTLNGTSSQLLVVAPNAPWKTLQELVAAIRKDPGKLNYASGGVGSAAHLAAAAMLLATDTQAVHVPYKGSVEIIPSILAGATQFGCPVSSTAVGPVQQGTVRALATSGSIRMAQLPNVPTMREALGKDELVIEAWSGIWVPAGTPAAVQDVLFKAFHKLYEDPAIRAEHAAAGTIVALSASVAEFDRFVETETVKYERLVKATGLTTN